MLYSINFISEKHLGSEWLSNTERYLLCLDSTWQLPEASLCLSCYNNDLSNISIKELPPKLAVKG